MGVTFTHLLLPVPRSRTPSHDEMARLVGRLVDDGFLLPSTSPNLHRMLLSEGPSPEQLAGATGCSIQFIWHEAQPFPCPPKPDDFAAVGDRDFRLKWPVIDLAASGLQYPLTILPDWVDPAEAYYDIELYHCRQYHHWISELIEPFANRECEACGADLVIPSAELHEDSIFGIQMYRHCPSCGNEFRPEDRPALVNDPAARDRGRMVPGGATSSFALAVECGKCWATGAVPTIAFRSACEGALGFPLEPILDGTF